MNQNEGEMGLRPGSSSISWAGRMLVHAFLYGRDGWVAETKMESDETR
jgi:hypothetical protein